MGAFDYPNVPFSKDNWSKLLGAINDMNRHDFDSGWVPIGTKTFEYHLGLLPGHVLVYASDDSKGNPYQSDNATAVNAKTITITGPKKFCRVIANK